MTPIPWAPPLAQVEDAKKEPSIVMDSAATSTCIKANDEAHVKVLEEDSNKVFECANGTMSKAGKKAKLDYNMREPATDADTVPNLSTNSLLSTSKLADAGYITIFTKDEVKVFDGENVAIKVDGNAVMKGWRCPRTKLWRVPLKQEWNNINTETALLSREAKDLIMKKREELDPKEFVNSVYELPNLEQVVAWYHAAAGYPTKAT